MKNNKKKMITLTMVVGIIGIIFTVIMVNKINDGGRKSTKETESTIITEVNSETVNMNDRNEVNNVLENETENICELETEATTELETEPETQIEETTELKTELETEPETEPETQIEETTELVVENTTEATTEAKKETVEEITTSSSSGKTEYIELENGEIIPIGEGYFTTVTVITGSNNNKKELTIEEKLLIDEFANEEGRYKYNDMNYNRWSFKDEVLEQKNKWIKETFGTNFTHNGITFGWNEELKAYYWVNKYDTIHYMTSTSTYRDEYFCKKNYSVRIADYLGFYGTDSVRYHNEDSLYDSASVTDFNANFQTVTDVYANNAKYLTELGWTEVICDDGVARDWDFDTPEGLPACIESNGYISMYVKYSGDEKETITYFTIEEYNEFVNNNTWKVSSYRGSRGFSYEPEENWRKYIRKYVIVD